MFKNISLLLLVAAVSSVPLIAEPPKPLAQESRPAKPKILGPVELLDIIKPGAKPLAPGTYRLSHEWVGTLTTVGDEYKKNGLKPEAPEPLRLNFIFVTPKGVMIVSGQETKEGISFSRGFLFSTQLHDDAEILKTRELATLKSWYGKQHGATDGWGDGETTNWSEHWMFAGLQKDGTLHCQNIFAHVSLRIGTREKAFGEITPVTGQPEMVKIMNLMTGDFRPEKPANSSAK